MHRTGNEINAAIAALRLVKAARSPDARLPMIDEALLRLDGFAGPHGLLAHVRVTSVNAGADLEQLCRKIVEGQRLGGRKTVTLSSPDLWLDGATARRMLLVAAELVTNALRHSLAAGGKRLEFAVAMESTPLSSGWPMMGPASRPPPPPPHAAMAWECLRQPCCRPLADLRHTILLT